MKNDHSFNADSEKCADLIVKRREAMKRLRTLLDISSGTSSAQITAIAQIALQYTVGCPENRLIQLKPAGDKFDDRIEEASALIESLSFDQLRQILKEIIFKV